MTREARVGLLVAVSLLVLFAGFYFLKGSKVFSRDHSYHAFYDNVTGLQVSSTVRIRGMDVGKVSDIKLNRAQLNSKIEVIFEVFHNTRLPVGTIAKLSSIDLLGSKGIILDLGTSGDFLEDGATLPSVVEGGLVDKISVEVTPLLQDLRKVVNSVDSVLNSVNQVFSPKTRDDLQASVAALHATMDNFSALTTSMKEERETLRSVIRNANKITTELTNSRLTETFTNLNTMSDKLAQAPINETITNLNQMSLHLNEIAQKINTNQGSLGMLVHDKELYNNLTKTLEELAKLTEDLKKHPSRYVNLTIFGRKAQPAAN